MDNQPMDQPRDTVSNNVEISQCVPRAARRILAAAACFAALALAAQLPRAAPPLRRLAVGDGVELH
jgi:hypothetical protein